MAKNRQYNKPKPDNTEQINKAKEMFAAMSEKDKLFFLQQAGVFFLSWQGRLISPTPELRGLVNQVSRLANMINLLFSRVSRRQADVSALSVISEEEIQRMVIEPGREGIDQKISEIREVLDKQQTAHGGRRKNLQGQQQSGSDTAKQQQSVSNTPEKQQSALDTPESSSVQAGAQSESNSEGKGSETQGTEAGDEEDYLDQPLSG